MPLFDLGLNSGVTVRLGRVGANLPPNRAYVSDASCIAFALESAVLLLAAVNPFLEQSHMSASTSGAGSKRANKISWLKLVPGNGCGNFR